MALGARETPDFIPLACLRPTHSVVCAYAYNTPRRPTPSIAIVSTLGYSPLGVGGGAPWLVWCVPLREAGCGLWAPRHSTANPTRQPRKKTV
eukprot:scaffold23755_cov163-Isochrysis_galbana.AAC.4